MKIIELYKKIKKEDGFTLVESLVAILIISIGLTPALFSATSATKLSENIENNLIASHLVQEGVEVIRFLRDRNRFLCDDFSTGLIGTWIVSYDDDWVDCLNRDLTPAGGTPPVILKDSLGIYNYSTGTPTKFTRVVSVVEIVPLVEIMVTSTVYWPSKTTGPGCPSGTQCVSAESHLFNWMQ